MTAVSLCVVPALHAEDLKLNNETTVSFASQEQAKALLGVEDDFIKSLSPFDRSARMKTDREVTHEQFLKFVAANALDSKPEEQRAVEAAIKAIAPTVAKLNLKFPKSVLMVKTTGKEEGGASYTRGSAIILPQDVLSSGRGELEHTVAHELFHILTRNHPELRDALSRKEKKNRGDYSTCINLLPSYPVVSLLRIGTSFLEKGFYLPWMALV